MVKQQITQPCEHKFDGAIKVAEYIVEEIKRNVKSNQVNNMRYMNDYEGRLNEWKKLPLWQRMFTPIPKPMTIEAMAIWTERVFAGRPWDHKGYIIKAFKEFAVERVEYSNYTKGLRTYKSHFHKYKNYDCRYDIWSNIHYGYVGLSAGFSQELLLKGSNLAQVLDNSGDNDPIDDITAIKIGFTLFEKFGNFAEKLTYHDVFKEILSKSNSDFPDARKVHICLEKK